MKPAITLVTALALLLPIVPAAGANVPPLAGVGLGSLATVATATVDDVVTGWQIRETDHICGLKNANQLSNPALIDFTAVRDATEEMKTLKREGIDPSSPRGQQLVNRATRRVTDASKKVLAETGHCSIWKAITHADGRAVADVTAAVRENL